MSTVMQSMRGPLQYISQPIRILGLDVPSMLGFAPVFIFPFSMTAWVLAIFNVLAVFVLARLRVPQDQLFRWLVARASRRVLIADAGQWRRDHFRADRYQTPSQ